VTASDGGGTYNGSAYGATVTVQGIDGTPASSLQGVRPTLSYYAATTVTGTPLTGTPTAAGTYTVVATMLGAMTTWPQTVPR